VHLHNIYEKLALNGWNTVLAINTSSAPGR
jgi:hypothetical protein